LLEVLAIANLLCLLVGFPVLARKLKKPAVAEPPATKAVTGPKVTAHRLVKTYIARGADGDHWIDGWRFLCSCGAKGCADGLVQSKPGIAGKMGNEISAIAKFKKHRDAYLDANGDDHVEHEDTVKLRKLEEEFAQWREACYCKDTNDDLILLKHRHLDSKQITKVK
jgi:hypothetical protein